MRLNRPANRPEGETIVALIDVIFFLLVFFMLVGRMDATAPFEVLPPLAETGTDMPAGGIVISVGQEGRIAFGGGEVPRDALAERLAPLIGSDDSLPVRIQAHGATELRFILPLVAEIETLGARDVSFVVTPAQP